MALSAGVSPSRFREIGGDVELLDSAPLMVRKALQMRIRQPFAQPVQRPAAHRYLAARVIDQAFRDARNPNGAPTDSASARAFLSGSPMLSYWCEVAELDPNGVIVRARTLMAGCDAGRRGRAGSADVH